MNSAARKRWLVAALGLAASSLSTVHADLRESGIEAVSRQRPARIETADRFDWADAAVGAGVATGRLVTASAVLGRKSVIQRGDRKEHE